METRTTLIRYFINDIGHFLPLLGGSTASDNGHEAAKPRRSSAERFRNVGVAGHRPPPQAP